MRPFYPALIVFACLLQLACASTHQQPSPYPPADSYSEIFAAMDEARQRAIKENKLLLYVMGANWCHDSVGFVTKTQTPEFSELIAQRYVVQLVNVGYLDHVREVINRYGEPVIYGTPTVLVVEPVTDTLLNRSTLPYWRNADAISLDDTLSYFENFEVAQTPPPPADYPPALALAMADIQRYEAQQAERIYLAYSELGGMMRAGEDDKPSADFMDKWRNLAAMRGQITVDLEALRSSAAEQAASGVDPIKLDYPQYALFIDAG